MHDHPPSVSTTTPKLQKREHKKCGSSVSTRVARAAGMLFTPPGAAGDARHVNVTLFADWHGSRDIQNRSKHRETALMTAGHDK